MGSMMGTRGRAKKDVASKSASEGSGIGMPPGGSEIVKVGPVSNRDRKAETESKAAVSWMTGAEIKIRHSSEEIKKFRELKTPEYWEQKLQAEAAEKQAKLAKEATEKQQPVGIVATCNLVSESQVHCLDEEGQDQEQPVLFSTQQEIRSEENKPAAGVVETGSENDERSRPSKNDALEGTSSRESLKFLDDLLNLNLKAKSFDFDKYQYRGARIEKKEGCPKRKSEVETSTGRTKRQRVEHPGTATPKGYLLPYYPCKFCPKCFIDFGSLVKHAQRVHPLSVARRHPQRKDDQQQSARPGILQLTKEGVQKQIVGGSGRTANVTANTSSYDGTSGQTETDSQNQSNQVENVNMAADKQYLEDNWLYASDDEEGEGKPKPELITID